MSVLSRCIGSLLALGVSAALASGEPLTLTQDELAKPERVEAKLRSGVSKEEQAIAQTFLAHGKKRLPLTKHTRNWGPIIKSFGESAIHDPTPKALLLYAEAKLRSWKEWSLPKSEIPDAKRATLTAMTGIYDSVLVANQFHRQLSAAEITNVKDMRQCINEYLRTKATQKSCPPLQWIGLEE